DHQCANGCDTLIKLKSAIRCQRPGLLSPGFCSWTIMQDPTQKGTQGNTFVARDGRGWILPHQTFTFFLHRNEHPRDVISAAMKRCGRL
ncbi:hypothetical protein AVEN_125560-2-1, partial [Araneus ventricosus]